MPLPKVSATVVASILLTGVLLNLAGSGIFGESVKKAAQYVTKGYGV